MFVYAIQPVVKPLVKPVWQLVVSCIQTFNRLSNRFDNWLYRVNGVLRVQPVWLWNQSPQSPQTLAAERIRQGEQSPAHFSCPWTSTVACPTTFLPPNWFFFHFILSYSSASGGEAPTPMQGALPLDPTGGTTRTPPFLPSHFKWTSAVYHVHRFQIRVQLGVSVHSANTVWAKTIEASDYKIISTTFDEFW